MSGFIPYQVDYSVKNAAKTLGFSKKRVTFKFGFANQAALDSGANGPACRGSEHELTFLWSLKTGKRQLLLDNKDLHFSESGQNGWTADRAWQHVFTLRDPASGRSYRVHFCSQPQVKEVANSHPFDMRIGGLSYFQFNPIYQLGTPRMVIGQQKSGGRNHHHGRDSPISAEERQQLAAAKLASLQDLATPTPAAPAPAPAMQHVEESLISFDDPPAPAVPAAVPLGATNSAGVPTNYYASSITLDPMIEENKQATNRQQPGSLYGSNPYQQPPPPQQQQQHAGYAMPYNTNPYGQAAPAPYGQTIAAAPAPPNTNYGANGSNALTPYQGQTGAPQQPYVDATGRVGMQPQQAPPAAYRQSSTTSMGSLGYSASTAATATVHNTTSNYNNTANFAAPMQSPMSYGSAPSFAQPPQQQQQPPPQYQTQPPPPPQYNSGYPPMQQQQQQQPPPNYYQNPTY